MSAANITTRRGVREPRTVFTARGRQRSGQRSGIFKAERSGHSSMGKFKNHGRKKFRKYLKGKVNHDMTLTTLAPETLLSEVVNDSLSEKAWLSSVMLKWAIDQWTVTTGVGPFLVGVAHSDYTSAEIEEWIENANSWESGDKIGQEIARRKIREIGTFMTPVGGNPDALTLNDGKSIRTKCGWMLNTGQTLRVWAMNLGTVAVVTTNPIVHINGHCNLWPA